MTVDPLLAAVVAVLVLVAVFLWQLARLAALKRRLLALESQLGAVRTDLEAVGTGSLTALERLDQLEPVTERLVERVGLVESSTQGRSYEQAVEAARRGATREHLVDRLGLTPAEADLVLAVHRPAGR